MTFHFYPWNDDYGPPFTDQEVFVEIQHLGYSKNSIYNLVTGNYTGIDSNARLVSGQIRHWCLYCRKGFRNPNALKIHLESHTAEPTKEPRAPIQFQLLAPPTFYIVIGSSVLSDAQKTPLKFEDRKEARKLINSRVILNASIVTDIRDYRSRRTFKWIK